MENMDLALNVTFVGLVVVFMALILLSFIISLFSKIFASEKKTRNGNTNNSNDEASVLEIEEDDERAASVQNITSGDELIAVLTAAVLACMRGKTESDIRVKSFRRIPQISPVWNVTSRKEQIASKL